MGSIDKGFNISIMKIKYNYYNIYDKDIAVSKCKLNITIKELVKENQSIIFIYY